MAEKNMMRPTAFSEHVVVVLAASAGCGEEGAVETAALLRRVHYAKFWRSSGAATSFQAATARHASRVESLRSSLFDRHARNFRQKLAHAQIPHLRLKFELHYGGGR